MEEKEIEHVTDSQIFAHGSLRRCAWQFEVHSQYSWKTLCFIIYSLNVVLSLMLAVLGGEVNAVTKILIRYSQIMACATRSTMVDTLHYEAQITQVYSLSFYIFRLNIKHC